MSFFSALNSLPYPFRYLSRKLLKKLNLGSYDERLKEHWVIRPHYGYILYHSARLAKELGINRISALEFGVASGNGLVNLEWHAEQISQALSIEIDIYGFDTSVGLPAPKDYRDLPYHWEQGFFKMDLPKLKARLKKAKLVIGNIEDTSKHFFEEFEPAPIAAIIHDFDFYSSTATALKMFDADEKYYLPRVYCYFDDVRGSEIELYNDYTGERLAINEFNETHTDKKIATPYHLVSKAQAQSWYHAIFIYHHFTHSKYNQFISSPNQQIQADYQ